MLAKDSKVIHQVLPTFTPMQNRRLFIKMASMFGISASSLTQVFGQKEPQQLNSDFENASKRVLFQGDSITDGLRTRNQDWNHIMGHGYAVNIAGRIWCDYPQAGFYFMNRGISGNKIPDLIARWQTDTLHLKPDLLSILVGVNDSALALQGKEGFTIADYEAGYRMLLQQSRQYLPTVKLVLCEPFVLPAGKVKDNLQAWENETRQRSKIVAALAKEFDACFVPFQQYFNEALERAPASFWIWDGIHPMPAGHELMARAWITEVAKKFPDWINPKA